MQIVQRETTDVWEKGEMSEKQTCRHITLSMTVCNMYATVFTVLRPTTTLTTWLCLKAFPIFHGETRYLGQGVEEEGVEGIYKYRPGIILSTLPSQLSSSPQQSWSPRSLTLFLKIEKWRLSRFSKLLNSKLGKSGVGIYLTIKPLSFNPNHDTWS